MEIIYEGICYILPRISTMLIHPITYHRHKLIWYPETRMTLYEQVQYNPYVKSVVTENPWIISCYQAKNVRIMKNGKWVRPEIKTYGTSAYNIMYELLDIGQTIPSIVYDGGKEIQQAEQKITKEIVKFKEK